MHELAKRVVNTGDRLKQQEKKEKETH